MVIQRIFTIQKLNVYLQFKSSTYIYNSKARQYVPPLLLSDYSSFMRLLFRRYFRLEWPTAHSIVFTPFKCFIAKENGSFTHVWPNALVKCCFFHLTQNIWRKVQTVGLHS